MRLRLRLRLLSAALAPVVILLAWLPLGQAGAQNNPLTPAPGSLLAPVGRQVGFLSLEAPRPRLLTSFAAPSYAADAVATPAAPLAALTLIGQLHSAGGASAGGFT